MFNSLKSIDTEDLLTATVEVSNGDAAETVEFKPVHEDDDDLPPEK
jgi:hypothetical protein